MEITISGKHFHVGDGLRQYLFQSLDQLKHEYEKLIAAKMVIESNKRGYRACSTLQGKYVNISAKSSDVTLHGAVNGAINKLNTRLVKRIKKLHNHSSHFAHRRDKISEMIELPQNQQTSEDEWLIEM